MGNTVVLALESKPVVAGGELRGTIYVEAGDSLEFNELCLEIQCEEEYEYAGRGAFEVAITESRRLFHAELVVMKESRVHVGGQHAFPFKVALPACPGSLAFDRNEFSAHITYSARATLYKPHKIGVLESDAVFFFVNEAGVASREQHFEIEHKVMQSSCCSHRQAGEVKLGVRTDKSTYALGEAVQVFVSVKNASLNAVENVTVALEESIWLFHSNDELCDTAVIQQHVVAANVAPDQLISSARFDFLIPADSICMRRAYGRHCVLLHHISLKLNVPEDGATPEIRVPIVIQFAPKTLKNTSPQRASNERTHWKARTEHELAALSLPPLKKSFGLAAHSHRLLLGQQSSDAVPL